MLRIGCHLSCAGGYLPMMRDAVSIGAGTLQFFTRNPRGGKAKELRPDDVSAALALGAEHDIAPLLAHAPYTLNGCSADESIRRFARETMADDLRRMEATPGNLYNFHPGSHVKQGTDIGIAYICEMLNEVLGPEMTTCVLLETMAGKGSEVGGCFEELARIIDGTRLSDKLGICLDTCHVWDAGYDIVGHLDEVLAEFDRVIGLSRLKAIHINDSLNDRGSRKDRHACIGQGKIGLEAMGRIVTHPALKHLPFNLETPNELPGYRAEIELLRELAGR